MSAALTPLTSWAGGTLVASAMLMAAVLLIRRPVAHAFGAKIAYALWLLPVLRMMLPPIPGEWALFGSAALFRPDALIGIAPVAIAAAPATIPAIAPAVTAPPTDWMSIALALWAVGAALHFSWQLIAYRIFLHRALRDAVLLTRAAGIEVLQCPQVPSPMATGVLRRRILLPADFTQRFAPEERRLALAHETAHHCRGDLIANLAGLALVSLHWFNPLAHVAFRAFRDDQEAACDATVLDAEPRDRRLAYGSAILKSASCRVPGAACALNHAGQLKRRISIMIEGRKSRTLRYGGGALALALVAGGLIGTASTVAVTDAQAHDIQIYRQGRTMTITENGRTRNATPAERRRADVAEGAAERAQVQAVDAEAALGVEEARLGEAEAALAQFDAPQPPEPPRAPEAPFAPEAPEAPVAPHAPHIFIDRAVIHAQVTAATAEARRAAAQARIEGQRARIEGERARIEAARMRDVALEDAAEYRRQALIDAEEARRAAAERRNEYR
jgi:beta-lactamase regulating signal transducer with metallopeptidase domain